MPASTPVVWSPRKLRWALNLYPPFFWHRAHVTFVAEDMREARVRLKRSLWNRNLNGSAFGGAIYTAADPWFPLLYWQALAREGIAVQAWLKACSADFRKPARSALDYRFQLTEPQLAAARDRLPRDGYSVHVDTVAAIDREGEVCATLECVSYLRLLRPGTTAAAGF